MVNVKDQVQIHLHRVYKTNIQMFSFKREISCNTRKKEQRSICATSTIDYF